MQQKKLIFGFDSGKNVNFQLIGDDFFTIPISKIMVPLEFPGFSLDKLGRILATYVGEKFIWVTGNGDKFSLNLRSTLQQNSQNVTCHWLKDV